MVSGVPKTLGKGKSKLTQQEFRSVYNSVFDGDADTFVGHLFRSFDSNHDGFVDFKEFIVGLCVSGSDKPETKLKWAFNMYDLDENGSISREEMSNMLKAIYRMITTDLSNMKADLHTIDALVDEFFKSADRNHDNCISGEEFVSGVRKMPVILDLLQRNPEDDAPFEESVTQLDAIDISKEPLCTNGQTDPSERAKAYVAT